MSKRAEDKICATFMILLALAAVLVNSYYDGKEFEAKMETLGVEEQQAIEGLRGLTLAPLENFRHQQMMSDLYGPLPSKSLEQTLKESDDVGRDAESEQQMEFDPYGPLPNYSMGQMDEPFYRPAPPKPAQPEDKHSIPLPDPNKPAQLEV